MEEVTPHEFRHTRYYSTRENFETFDPSAYFKAGERYEKYDPLKRYTSEPFEWGTDGRRYTHRLVCISGWICDKRETIKYVTTVEFFSPEELIGLRPYCQCEYCVGDWYWIWQRPCSGCVGCLQADDHTGGVNVKVAQLTREYKRGLVLTEKYDSSEWLCEPLCRTSLGTLFLMMCICLASASVFIAVLCLFSFLMVASKLSSKLRYDAIHRFQACRALTRDVLIWDNLVMVSVTLIVLLVLYCVVHIGLFVHYVINRTLQ